LFFQVALLVGYLYADALVRRLTPKAQLPLHLAALAITLLALPVTPAGAWKPSGAGDPLVRILALLAGTVGLPYLLLSTTSPLMQAWYARNSHGAMPYRLYALSNLGSLLALIAYPLCVEPYAGTDRQLAVWSAGYAVFAVLSAVCALVNAFATQRPAAAPVAPPIAESTSAPRLADRLLWIGLAACGSILLLAVTNHLTQNIASIPFLWILPLVLYLATFILCFDRPGFYRPAWWRVPLAAALLAMGWGLVKFDTEDSWRLTIPVFSICLFICCVFCHGELARRKPAPAYLTPFYVMISAGGALGALLVTVAAPYLFDAFYELPLIMVVCGILALALNRRAPLRHRAIWGCLVIALAIFAVQAVRASLTGNRVVVRNFYGGLRVTDSGSGASRVRTLIHGTINHGEQFLDPARRREPPTYYGRLTGIGLAIEGWRKPGERVGVVGLGTGTIASYGRPGDYYRFYDINPLIVKLAHEQFTFLPDSTAKIDIVLGDGRLSLERDPPQRFDVLAIDAFSGDSIPVHLLTREALFLYRRHLKPNGVLALHISNANLDLAPVAQKVAESVDRKAMLVSSDDDDVTDAFSADWVLVPERAESLNRPLFRSGRWLTRPLRARAWTDDYSNLLQLLRY
jgi:hypothetical protein